MKKVIVLGSTGSIGKQTLSVISKNPNLFTVVGLSCARNVDLMKKQAQDFSVKFCSCKNYPDIQNNIFCNELDLVSSVDFDILVAGSGGVDSLDAVIYALDNNKRVAIANKELLVCAGNLLTSKSNGNLIPVDSEHCAIFQCLQNSSKDILNITLTASGGALRDYPIEKLNDATKQEVLRHPNWLMGDKITVDCATMANKAFEVIEAMHLFGVTREQVNVVIHKQSVVHGLVTFVDGSIIAQMAAPDMQLPISYALAYPNRINAKSDFSLVGKSLDFELPDKSRYPIFDLIVEQAGSDSKCAYLSGADAAVVKLFLDGVIRYGDMHTILKQISLNLPDICVNSAKIAQQLYYDGFNKALSLRNLK